MEDKKMQVVLLVAVLLCGCVLGIEDLGRRPCQPTKNRNAFFDFEKKHILPKNFNTSSKPAWQRHISRLNRCKEPTQTFIESANKNRIIAICNSQGWNQEGNLCTSEFKLPVHVVTVAKTKCRVKKDPAERIESVTVACDKVGKLCLPVHFEAKAQRNERRRSSCSPPATALAYWFHRRFNVSDWID